MGIVSINSHAAKIGYDMLNHIRNLPWLPQKTLTKLAGILANCRWPWLKNPMIKWFVKQYQVDLSDAVITRPTDYDTFNHFFTRALQPSARSIDDNPHSIVSPVDGTISQVGIMQQHSLIQAKGHHYELDTLLGGNTDHTGLFNNGHYLCMYLSPKDYHRVHMPYAGQLRKTIYIPGRLFSVDNHSVAHIPHLFTRNERLVCLFDTDSGPMAIILVGAMIVGSIATVWDKQVITRSKALTLNEFSQKTDINLNKGSEMGHFQLGSTVILLFGQQKINWLSELTSQQTLKMGQTIGTVL